MGKSSYTVHRDTMWKILRHDGVPQNIVNRVQMTSNNCSSQVKCNNEVYDSCTVTTGVKQGSIHSPFLVVLGIDWFMTNVGYEVRRAIRCESTCLLEDLSFADDIALLSQIHQFVQAKIDNMKIKSGETGLNICATKTTN